MQRLGSKSVQFLLNILPNGNYKYIVWIVSPHRKYNNKAGGERYRWDHFQSDFMNRITDSESKSIANA